MKHTLLIGASSKADRYAYKAYQLLTQKGNKSYVFEEGNIIETEPNKLNLDGLDTVTLYLYPDNQIPYYNFILGLKPKRVIFNPGTENPKFYQLLNKEGIFFEEACTLVLLNLCQY
jgi:uncharacterized protein